MIKFLSYYENKINVKVRQCVTKFWFENLGEWQEKKKKPGMTI